MMVSHINGTSLSRRLFLVSGAAAGSALVLGFPFVARRAGAQGSAPDFVANAYVRIAADGQITVTTPFVEMGQGTYTAVPMLIAEELSVELGEIKVEHAPADDKLYTNPLLGRQETDGSTSMRVAWDIVRKAGATARAMLVAAAAKQLGVGTEEMQVADGTVVHVATGRRLSYGELAGLAATMPLPTEIVLKDAASFTVIGTAQKRLDTPSKVDGSAQFGIDVKLPRMKVAAVAASPVLGGKLRHVDPGPALATNGVRDVVLLEDAVAVLADHWAAAKKGLDSLSIEWDDGPNAEFSTGKLEADLEAASAKNGVVALDVGDETADFAKPGAKFEATYSVPLLAHAAMEPINCTVRLENGRCDVWLGTQAATRALSAAAEAAGLPEDKVLIHNQYLGGSFGRRAETDNVIQAVLIAKQVDYPVKVIWSREEDTQHDYYRPYYLDKLRARLGDAGMVESWFHRIVGSSPLTRWLPVAFPNGDDPDATTSASGPYSFPNAFVDFVRHEEKAFRTGFWRGVGTTHNAFTVESFMDELAVAAGKDPIEFRRLHLKDDARLTKVLDIVAEKSGWGSPLLKRSGRGVSLLQDFGGTILAHVAEVEVSEDGRLRVTRVTSVIDCGKIINPDTVIAQVQGGVIFGISAALYGEITFSAGRVEQGNFDSYGAVRMDEAPAVSVHLIESGPAPFGVGESGTAGIAPAIANALYAATSKRLRRLPLSPDAINN